MISNITAPIALGQATANYVIKEAEGFGSGDVEVMKWNRPGFHGIKTPRAFWRERIMRLVIGVVASTSAEYETRRRALLAAFDTPRKGLIWLKFTTQGGLALQTKVHLNSQIQAPLRAGEVTIGDFRIELIAEDPIFYSQTLTTEDITFSAGSGTLTNDGDAPVFPEARIHGKITSPTITNSTVDKALSFPGAVISAGDYYDIDMLEELVLDRSGLSKYSNLDDNDFFWLPAGNSTIILGGTIGGSGLRKVAFSYRSGYLGV